MKTVDGDEVHAASAQGACIEMLLPAHDHLLIGAADLDNVEWRSRGHAQSLALADSEVVNAGVLADDFAVRGYQVTRRVGQSLALLGEIGVDETLVVAAGNEADFLRVGLLSECQSVLASEFANRGLGQVSEREDRAPQLLLSQAEEKVSLILARIGGALEQPAAATFVESHASVVSGGNSLSSNLLGHNE